MWLEPILGPLRRESSLQIVEVGSKKAFPDFVGNRKAGVLPATEVHINQDQDGISGLGLSAAFQYWSWQLQPRFNLLSLLVMDLEMYKGVIFDMDGVLVNNLDCHVKAFQQLGREKGVNLTAEQVRSVFGRSTVDMLSAMTGWKIGREEGLELDDRKEKIYREFARPVMREIMVPGLRELLEYFRSASVTMAVASSGPDENVNMVLEELDIKDYFAAVVTASHVRKGKPDPKCFLLAAEGVGVNPSECLVFEDSRSGIQAALAAGCRCVALTTTHSPEEIEDLKPDLIVADFEEYIEQIQDY